MHAVPAFASVTLFGPKRYTVAAGADTTVHETLAAADGCDGPNALYTLVITNGNPDGTGSVKDGAVVVNGADVTGSALHDGVATIEKHVALAAANTLDVTLRGGTAAGAVTLTLRRELTQDVVAPKGYTLTASKSASYDETVTASAGSAIVIVTNGTASVLPVDDIRVTVNGTPLITKADVDSRGNQDERQTLFVPVTLAAQNALHIEISANRVPSAIGVRIVRMLTDSAAPKISITTPAGPFALASPLTVSGRVTDDTGVAKLTIGGAAVPLAGDGSFTRDVALTPGANRIALDAADCEGTHATAEVNVFYDVAPPVVTVTSPAANSVSRTNTIAVAGTAADDDAIAGVTVNGTVATLGGTAWTANVTLPGGDGARQLVVIATDRAGRQTTASVAITIDATAPRIEGSISPVPNSGGWNGGPVTVTFQCSDAGSGVAVCPEPIALTSNGKEQHVRAEARDRAGNTAGADVIVNIDGQAPEILGLPQPTPNLNGWNNGPVQVVFLCGDAISGTATCSQDRTVSGDGANQRVAGAMKDLAGNTDTSETFVNIDSTAPIVQLDDVPQYATQLELTLHGMAADALSGIASVTCNGFDATVANGRFDCTMRLERGTNAITVRGIDRAGNVSEAAASIVADTGVPTIALDETPSLTSAATIVITGNATDDDRIGTLTIGGTPVALSSSGAFEATVALADGANSIAVEANDRAGNRSTQSVSVTRFSVPHIAITSPEDLAVTRYATTTVSGTIDDAQTVVDVNGVAATVSGGTFTAQDVPLAQGRTVITATATNAGGRAGTSTINLYRDSIPPRLTVYSPQNDTTVYASPISISGMVDDIVVGTINDEQMRVTVNSVAAEVSNRAFLLRDVALVPGLNTFLITALDEGGNATTTSYRVTLATAPQAHLEVVSGNGQKAVIGKTLAQPLVVRAVSANGAAAANSALTFTVIENNGVLAADGKSGRTINVTTDADGRASVQWTLGTRAGSGNQRVEVRGNGFAAPIELAASGRTGVANLIVVDSGNTQFGLTGELLPRPLVAVVVDAGSNRLADVPVTFTATRGGGTFDGQPSITVQTDSDGRAIVRPMLGAKAGQDNNVFTATVASLTNNAVFVASARNAGPVTNTRISGVILDNTSIPIAGVSVRIDGTTTVVQTDAQGQFAIQPAPVGYVKLFVDGSTAQRSGSWPTLEYALYALPGVDNTVGMPIYLLPVDVRRGLFTDDTTGGTLTLPELPGFALNVAPGSATFPGGGRTGTVSATLVHADRIPMQPGFGQQPKFIVTIQPPGVHFDPPAQLSFPNVDGLAPGEVTEMYSFDHDLGQFVAIGTGSVSADGSVVTSDPGVGIIKGGWHCGGNPNPDGTSSNCNECSRCDGVSCVANPDKQDKPCRDDGNPETIDLCDGTACVHKKPKGDLSVRYPTTMTLPEEEEEAPGGVVALQLEWDTPVTEVVAHKLEPAIPGARYRLVVRGVHLAIGGSITEFDANSDYSVPLIGKGVCEHEAEEAIELHLIAAGKDTVVDTIRFTVVFEKYYVALRIFIPYQWVGVPHPFYAGVVAHGDDRDYSTSLQAGYRSSQLVTVHPYPQLFPYAITDPQNLSGMTIHYDRMSSLPYWNEEVSTDINRLYPEALAEALTPENKGEPYMVNYGIAATDGMHITDERRDKQQTVVRLAGSAKEPIIWFAAAINWNLRLTFNTNVIFHNVDLIGVQDGFPAYELYVRPDGVEDWTTIYQFKPPPGRTVLGLMPSVDNETILPKSVRIP